MPRPGAPPPRYGRRYRNGAPPPPAPGGTRARPPSSPRSSSGSSWAFSCRCSVCLVVVLEWACSLAFYHATAGPRTNRIKNAPLRPVFRPTARLKIATLRLLFRPPARPTPAAARVRLCVRVRASQPRPRRRARAAWARGCVFRSLHYILPAPSRLSAERARALSTRSLSPRGTPPPSPESPLRAPPRPPAPAARSRSRCPSAAVRSTRTARPAPRTSPCSPT